MVREFIPTLHRFDDEDFTSTGYGFLYDGISCEVTEEIGNSFELEMRYPITGIYFDEMKIGNIICSKVNTATDVKQPFRIYRITKPIDGAITVYAQHLTYDLAGYTVDEANKAYEKNDNATVDTIIRFIQKCIDKYVDKIGGIRFELSTDGEFDKAAWSIPNYTDVRSMMRTAAKQFNGQWEYNGKNCILHEHRGQDRGVSIDYGKNLEDITEDADISRTFSHVMPYYKGKERRGEEEVDIVIGGLSAAVETGADIGYNRTVGVDFSSEFTYPPTVEVLQRKALEYISVEEIGKIVISRDVKAVDRGQTVEYPGMSGAETVEIGDTVKINVPVLGISASMRCMSLTYDAYLDIITAYEIGDIKKSYIADTAKDIDDRMRGFDDDIDDINSKIEELEEELNERAPTLFVQEEEPQSTDDDPLVNDDYWLEHDEDKYAVAFYKYSSGWGLQCYFRGEFDPIISDEQPVETTSAIEIYDIWVLTGLSDSAISSISNIGQLNISDVKSISDYTDSSWQKCIYGYGTTTPQTTYNTEVGDYWFRTDSSGKITGLYICTEMSRSGQSYTARWGTIYPTDETGRSPKFYIMNREVCKKNDYWLKVQTGTVIAQSLSKWSGSLGSDSWIKVVDFYEYQPEPGIGGVGEYLDVEGTNPNTAERFNDYRDFDKETNTGGNWTEFKYDHIEGYGNHVLIPGGVPSFLYIGYNHLEGWDNTLNGAPYSCTHIEGYSNTETSNGGYNYNHITGMMNKVTDCNNCFVGGQHNNVGLNRPTYTGDSMVFGDNNKVYGVSTGSIVVGGGNEVHNCYHTAVFGNGNLVDPEAVYGLSTFMCGNGGKVTSNDQMFVIGCGNASGSNKENCFEVRGISGVYAKGGYNTLGADYAEYFEWADGNPDNEDRCGMLVELVGDKIQLAHGDYIFGIISATPSVVGNGYDLHYQGKYAKDVFGRLITAPDGSPLISPDYDPEIKYIPRSERPEWSPVGMVGRLVIVDDGSCKVGGHVSARHGIGTSCYANTGIRVLKRINENHVEVIIK